MVLSRPGKIHLRGNLRLFCHIICDRLRRLNHTRAWRAEPVDGGGGVRTLGHSTFPQSLVEGNENALRRLVQKELHNQGNDSLGTPKVIAEIRESNAIVIETPKIT